MLRGITWLQQMRWRFSLGSTTNSPDQCACVAIFVCHASSDNVGSWQTL